jgi:hypothetical protein
MRSTRVLLVAPCLFAVMAVIAQGEGAARQAPPAANTERTEGAVMDASIVHPASWTVERERYTSGGTYGFTLWRPEPGGSQDYGGTPAVRVALAEKLRPSGIEAEVGQTLAYYENQGVAFGPSPGAPRSRGSTYPWTDECTV